MNLKRTLPNGSGLNGDIVAIDKRFDIKLSVNGDSWLARSNETGLYLSVLGGLQKSVNEYAYFDNKSKIYDTIRRKGL